MPIEPYKRPWGVYYLRGSHLGRSFDRSAKTRCPKEAGILAAKLEAQVFEEYVHGPKAVVTFGEAAANYIRGGGEWKYVAPISAELGRKKLRDLDQAALDAAALKIKPNASDSTRLRKVYTPFIAIWNLAVENKLADARKWRKPRVDEKRIDWCHPEEIDALLAELYPQPRDLATFYVGSGARATEGLDLKWCDVSPAAQRVTLWETKGGYSRHVDLGWRVRRALPARQPNGYVFRNRRGQPWSSYDSINNDLWRACDRAGIRRLSCHVLRHTWATWTYALTRDLNRLMAQGGWRSAQLAMRYIHAGTDDLARQVEKFGWAEGILDEPAKVRRVK